MLDLAHRPADRAFVVRQLPGDVAADRLVRHVAGQAAAEAQQQPGILVQRILAEAALQALGPGVDQLQRPLDQRLRERVELVERQAFPHESSERVAGGQVGDGLICVLAAAQGSLDFGLLALPGDGGEGFDQGLATLGDAGAADRAAAQRHQTLLQGLPR